MGGNQESFMLRNSVFAEKMENELKDFKIGWDAGIQDKLPWLINWPKLEKEKELKRAAPTLKKWIKKWKAERLIKDNDNLSLS